MEIVLFFRWRLFLVSRREQFSAGYLEDFVLKYKATTKNIPLFY